MSGYFGFSVRNGIAEIVLDSPGSKVNLLSSAMLADFKRFLETEAAGGGIKALVLRSGKKDAFVAGADINEIGTITDAADAEAKSAHFQSIFNLVEDLPYPTICAIDGACVGGGLELALACTYRLVTDNPKTRLALPEVTLGIIPGAGGTFRLPRLIGLSRALPMIAAGKALDGKTAYAWGLADQICRGGFLDECVSAFVNGLPDTARKRKRKSTSPLMESNPIGRALLFRFAKRETMRKTKGDYPAPLAALRTIRRTYGKSREYALLEERKAFAALAGGQVSKNLIGVYLSGERRKKEIARFLESPLSRGVESPGVLGAGKMGGGIASLAASSGFPVLVKDTNWAAVGAGLSAVRDDFGEMVNRKKIDARTAALGIQRVTGTLSSAGFRGVDFVVEAIIEDAEIKKEAYAELEKVLMTDAVIATNTSSFMVGELAAGLERPERFIGMHFFSPVNRMPLVEIVPGEKTAPETTAAAAAFAKRLGKTPIIVKDCRGFLVNRILMSYLDEALRAFDEGADIAETDRAMTAFGMPVGPFALMDEVGLKVAFKAARNIAAAYPERSETGGVFRLIGESEELKGRAAGKGFYLYSGKGKEPNPAVYSMRPDAGAAAKTDYEELRSRMVSRLVNEAALCLEEEIAAGPDVVDIALILGAGFPAFRGGILRYADGEGLDRIVAVMRDLEAAHGKRFAPAASLSAMAVSGSRFYP